jgi:hypothetical protein
MDTTIDICLFHLTTAKFGEIIDRSMFTSFYCGFIFERHEVCPATITSIGLLL